MFCHVEIVTLAAIISLLKLSSVDQPSLTSIGFTDNLQKSPQKPYFSFRRRKHHLQFLVSSFVQFEIQYPFCWFQLEILDTKFKITRNLRISSLVTIFMQATSKLKYIVPTLLTSQQVKTPFYTKLLQRVSNNISMLKLCSKKNYPAGYQLEMKAGPAVECYDKIVTSKDLGVRTGTMTKICEQRSTVSLLWKLCVKVLWKSMKIITTIQYQRLTHSSYNEKTFLRLTSNKTRV